MAPFHNLLWFHLKIYIFFVKVLFSARTFKNYYYYSCLWKIRSSICAIRHSLNLKKPSWRYVIVGTCDLFLPLYKMGWGRGIITCWQNCSPPCISRAAFAAICTCAPPLCRSCNQPWIVPFQPIYVVCVFSGTSVFANAIIKSHISAKFSMPLAVLQAIAGFWTAGVPSIADYIYSFCTLK